MSNGEQAQETRRLSVEMDMLTLRQRGRITVELKEEPEAVETKLSLSIFDDDDDSEEGQMVDCDGGREGGSERSFMAKNKYKYLMDDVSGKVFEKPPEGTVIEDLLSDGSVLKNMIRKGQGDLIPENCKVFVQYIIVTDGPISHEIDSTLTPGRCRPEAIDLRNPSVIPGFYVALRSMSLFEVAKFMIRYDQAYGANGCLPRVPPWTDVICTMEVISFLDEEQLKTVEHMDPPDRLALPFSKILEYSSQKKDEGSIQFKLKDFAGAKRAYYQAAKVLEEYPVTDESESDEKSSLLFTLFNNLAACCLKLEKWEHASVACLKGLQCSSSVASQSAKLLYRYAVATRNIGDGTKALELINKAIQIDPCNTLILAEKENIKQRINEENNASKVMMSRIGKGIVQKPP